MDGAATAAAIGSGTAPIIGGAWVVVRVIVAAVNGTAGAADEGGGRAAAGAGRMDTCGPAWNGTSGCSWAIRGAAGCGAMTMCCCCCCCC